MSTPYHLTEQFQVFDLPVTAALETVDEQYFQITEELCRRRSESPERWRTRQKEVDDAYYIVLQHFLETPDGCDLPKVTYDNIEKHRYETSNRKKRKRSRSLDQGSSDSPMRDADPDCDFELFQEGDQRRRLSSEYWEVIGKSHLELRNLSVSDSAKAQKTQDWFELNYMQGDIFRETPDGAIIVRAWGKGFAAALKDEFPAAFEIYRKYCNVAKSRKDLVGSCLLIHPQASDYRLGSRKKPARYIACLFASIGYGEPSLGNPGKDSEADIIDNTGIALAELRAQLEDFEDDYGSQAPGDIYSPKINSGLFGVPWEDTSILIEAMFDGSNREWLVYEK